MTAREVTVTFTPSEARAAKEAVAAEHNRILRSKASAWRPSTKAMAMAPLKEAHEKLSHAVKADTDAMMKELTD
jgi:hypothetical protein